MASDYERRWSIGLKGLPTAGCSRETSPQLAVDEGKCAHLDNCRVRLGVWSGGECTAGWVAKYREERKSKLVRVPCKRDTLAGP